MLAPDIFKGGFGIERETLRTDINGKISQTPHPFKSERFVRDFFESQLELITPVCDGTQQLMRTLADLDSEASKTLASLNEYMWLSSNPPHFTASEPLTIARYSGNESAKYDYRVYLGNKYGKKTMLYSGIHLNFSFSEATIKQLYNNNGDYTEFKNNLYFRLSKQLLCHSWLLVLLTAASPVCDSSYINDNESGAYFNGYASLRNSENGYWNKFTPILDYSNLQTYIESINKYIENGLLFSAAELYLPIRLKPKGSNSPENLLEKGINHIELRMFDVNPLAPLGIFKEDLDFAHYLMLYLIHMPDFEFTPRLQKSAIDNHKSAARYELSDVKINNNTITDEAILILNNMEDYFREHKEVLKNITLQKDKLLHDKRYCIDIYRRHKTDYQTEMQNTSKQHSYKDKNSGY